MFENNNYLSAVSGVAKKKAKTQLNNVVSLGENLKKNDSSFQNISKGINGVKNKLENVDKLIPNINAKVENAAKDLNYVNTKNKTVLSKSSGQGFIKNLFDSEGRFAKKEVYNSKKALDNAIGHKEKRVSEITHDLNKRLDLHNANLKKWESDSGMNEIYKQKDEMQKAYDKATRSTTRARVGTLAGIGATGVGVNSLQKNKNNPIKQEDYYQ